MIVAGSANPLLLSSAGGYNLTRSLRFRSSASAYLSRTPASSGNRQVFTVSAWVKRGKLGVQQHIIGGNNDITGDNQFNFGFGSDDKLGVFNSATYPSNYYYWATTAVYRDPSAWYHVVLAVDTTQATAGNRIKLYVNGSEITSWSTQNNGTQNMEFQWNRNVIQGVGAYPASAGQQYYDGYMTEIHSIDGQTLTASSFGENNAQTGVWQPKKYTGTYGTNGFYLPFTDNSALTSGSNAGLGKDFSGNGNYWNTNNISITAGSTYDSMTDVPTLTSATAANFAVLNPLQIGANGTLSSANLNFASSTAGGYSVCFATMGVSSGKWYWEVTATSSAGNGIGIATSQASLTYFLGGDAYGWMYYQNGDKYTNNVGASYGASYTTNDVIGVALDADAGSITCYKNGTSQGTMFSGLSVNTYFPAVSDSGSTTTSCVANFGQRPFAYTPPTGYVALNTYNLPTPTIGATASTQANKYFDASLYSGNTTTVTATNGGFQPDLVWIKDRSQAAQHVLTDAVRGTSSQLFSSLTNAEQSNSTYVTAFNSNGFTVGVGNSGTGVVNNTGDSFVGWQWKGGNGTVSNTAGSITSTVSANTSAGFSVVTYTGNAVNGATVGHGLGVAPKIVIVKSRSLAEQWPVNIGNITGVTNDTMWLNSTSGKSAQSTRWQGNPSSTVFYLGAGVSSDEVNKSGATYVAYCFAEVAGYSKFGSYTGNGSSDGTFVYTGFRPRYVMFKRTDTTANWVVIDTARDTYNVAGKELFPNLSDAENDNRPEVDLLSNGFKLRWTYNGTNASGGNYIYAAFAENPYKYSLAR